MNIDTGKIERFTDKEIQDIKEDWVRINEADMTDKQRTNMKVSLYDTRSILGKKLHGERRKRTLRTLRKKGKLK